MLARIYTEQMRMPKSVFALDFHRIVIVSLSLD